MKVSWNWLRELVRLDDGVSPHDAAARLSGAGVAVDAVTAVGHGLRQAIVAEIRGKRPHPKADKLTLVDVFDGKEVTQVVCGAPNVPEPLAPGRSPRVVWARPGATLPSGQVLSVREVRGIPSPGMLCAEDELGLSTDHAGILILQPEDRLEIGSDFATAAGLADYILELDITPNRPDLLGHVGVARELAALYAAAGARLTLPAPDLVRFLDERPASSAVSITIEDPAGCARYLGHVLSGLRVAKSPLPLRLLLQRLGARPVNNLVDATNLALYAFGQPLHAFDLSRLSGAKVIVRRAKKDEVIKTLDGASRPLSSEDLVIADAHHPIAVAGVMGGEESEVRAQTSSVLLESAYFDPISVRRTARRLKMHTEASHRFERGVDPNSCLDLSARYCLERMLELGGGRLLRGCIDVYPHSIEPKVLDLRPARTSQILGLEVPGPTQAEKLTALGLTVSALDSSTLSVTVPTFRPDLTREIDLIEEIGRLVGYDAVVPRIPPLRMAPPPEQSPAAISRKNAERARDLCAALGLYEVQLFSMISPEKLQKVQGGSTLYSQHPPLMLENPLRDELSAMRTQLLPSLLEALSTNLNHGLTDVRLFEVAEVFWPRPGHGLPEERVRVAAVLCGYRPFFLSATAADALDVYDVRSLVEELLGGLGHRFDFAPAGAEASAEAKKRGVYVRAATADEAPWLHPGVAAAVVSMATGQPIGSFGEVHPELRAKLGIERTAFCFELDVPTETLRPESQRYVLPSRFPAVTRDLSFFIDKDIPAGVVCAAIKNARVPLLADLAVLEDYREAGKVPQNQKGLLLSITYRSDERTLTDEEVQKAHESLLNHLQQALTIKLR